MQSILSRPVPPSSARCARCARYALWIASSSLVATSGFGAPTGGVVAAGSAEIRQNASGTQTDIVQTSQRAVIDWKTFNVGVGEGVYFRQPGKSAWTLNRIGDLNPSVINGRISADGNVILLNSNGVIFGGGARVDTGGLIVSTARLSNDDFSAGRLNFTASERTGGSIINRGTINITEGGLAAFVAPHVRNDGLIYARLGKIILGSGSSFTLDLNGDGLVNLRLRDEDVRNLVDAEQKKVSALIENNGTIAAQSGKIVVVTPTFASNLIDNAVNLGGIVRADTVRGGAPGEIILEAKNGKVNLSGEIAAAKGDGEKEGSFELRRDEEETVVAKDAAGDLGRILRTGTSLRLTSTGDLHIRGPIDGRGSGSGAGVTLVGKSITLLSDVYSDDGAIVARAGAGGFKMEPVTPDVVPGRPWPMLFAGKGNISIEAEGSVRAAHLVTTGDVTVESKNGNVALVAPLGADFDGKYPLANLTVKALGGNGNSAARDVGNVTELYDVTVASNGKISINARLNIQLFAPFGARSGLNAARNGLGGRSVSFNSQQLGTGDLTRDTAYYWSSSRNGQNSSAVHYAIGKNTPRDDGRWADLSKTDKDPGVPTAGAPPGPTQAGASPLPAVTLSGISTPEERKGPPGVLPGSPVLPDTSDPSLRNESTMVASLRVTPGSLDDEADPNEISANRGVVFVADIGRTRTVDAPRNVFRARDHVVRVPICNTSIGGPYFKTNVFGGPLVVNCD